MRVAVIGAGIVGVTTAYELATDGHEVAVFERNGSVAAGGSFANAGIVAPGGLLPWDAGGKRRGVFWQLLGADPSLRLASRADLASVLWARRRRRSHGEWSEGAAVVALHRLAGFSQQRLHAITRQLRLDYERADGLLVLLRTADDLQRAQPRLAGLAELGVKHRLLDGAACRAAEPGLNDETTPHAGIYFEDGEVGNCRQFANLLRASAQRLGVRFRYHTEVQSISAGRHPQIVRVYAPPVEKALAGNAPDPRDDEGVPTQPMAFEAVTESFDAVVVCAASGCAPLLAPLGLDLPIMPIYGYSITAPMRQDEQHPNRGPRAGIVDQRMQVAITRIGARVRVSGIHEIGGKPARHDKASLDLLYKVLHDWFPGVARLAHALPWKGARPTLPDERPILGAAPARGVWLNLGHGGHGWGLACGSARTVADQIATRAPAVDIGPFSAARWRK